MKFTELKNFKINSLSYYFSASILSTLIGLIINPFLSIGLNHNDYAIIGYYASFSSILAPILAFSLHTYYARNYFLVNEEERNELLQTILTLFLVFSFLVFSVFFCLYYIYHIESVKSIPFSPYALLSFMPIYISSFYNLYILDLRMQEKAKKYAFVTVLYSILGSILSLLLVYVFRFGATGRLIASLLVAFMFAVFSLKVLKFKFRINLAYVLNALSFCWPLTISAILTFFFMGIDRTFLVKLNDNHTLGLYNIGIQISGYLGLFGTVIFQTFQPDIYKFTSQNNHKKVFYLIISIIGLSIIPNLLFVVFSKPLIIALTYGRYADATGFTNILILKNIAITFAFIMSETLIGYGYPRFELVNRILGSILAIILYKYLIQNWGFNGAAWGQSFSWFCMGLISTICLLLIMYKKRRLL